MFFSFYFQLHAFSIRKSLFDRFEKNQAFIRVSATSLFTNKRTVGNIWPRERALVAQCYNPSGRTLLFGANGEHVVGLIPHRPLGSLATTTARVIIV